MVRCLVLAALLLGGCAPLHDRLSRRDGPVGAGDVAALRERCPPGTFMGTMTGNCPDVVR